MKKTLLMIICIAAAFAVQALEFQTIRDNAKNMTSMQFDQFKRLAVGQTVQWSGWVDEVTLPSGGRCKLLVDMDPPDALSVYDVSFRIQSTAAMRISKDQKLVFRGIIKKIDTGLFGLTVFLESVGTN